MHRTVPVGAAVLGIAAVFLFRAPRRSDAVTISPTAIYLSSRERTTSFELYNGEDSPAEVELSLAFGYPTSDSLGRVDVALADTAPSGEPSAVPWLRLYPRRVVLQPKQRQLVRVGAYPPAIAAGEYWARLLVRSRPAPPPVEATDAGNRARSQLRIETLFVTAVNYRNGTVATGVQVDSASTRVTDSTAALVLDLRRTGNAAFVGRLDVELRGSDGVVAAHARENIAVYHTMRRVVVVPLSRDWRGLSLAYRLTTDRDDLGPRAVVRAEPVSGQVPLSR